MGLYIILQNIWIKYPNIAVKTQLLARKSCLHSPTLNSRSKRRVEGRAPSFDLILSSNCGLFILTAVRETEFIVRNDFVEDSCLKICFLNIKIKFRLERHWNFKILLIFVPFFFRNKWTQSNWVYHGCLTFIKCTNVRVTIQLIWEKILPPFTSIVSFEQLQK